MTVLILKASRAAEPPRIPVEALGRLLDDLAVLLAGLDRNAYVTRSRPGVSGSVGAHVRHVLDHVSAFVEAGSRRLVNYDRRQRGTDIEVNPEAALSAICSLQVALGTLGALSAEEPVQVVTQFQPGAAAVATWSSIGRELAFVINHTIHHHAIVALLLDGDEQPPLPARFGYAPSTPVEN
jgi:uncharacterized damage-inducible protein DinB